MRTPTPAALVVAAGPLVGLLGLAAPASAAATESAVLNCGEAGEFVVTGFGRGQVLHVVDGPGTFVVTFAQLLPSGRIVFDNPGLADAVDLVSCTTTSPVSGQAFAFRGFFTPRA